MLRTDSSESEVETARMSRMGVDGELLLDGLVGGGESATPLLPARAARLVLQQVRIDVDQEDDAHPVKVQVKPLKNNRQVRYKYREQ